MLHGGRVGTRVGGEGKKFCVTCLVIQDLLRYICHLLQWQQEICGRAYVGFAPKTLTRKPGTKPGPVQY